MEANARPEAEVKVELKATVEAKAGVEAKVETKAKKNSKSKAKKRVASRSEIKVSWWGLQSTVRTFLRSIMVWIFFEVFCVVNGRSRWKWAFLVALEVLGERFMKEGNSFVSRWNTRFYKSTVWLLVEFLYGLSMFSSNYLSQKHSAPAIQNDWGSPTCGSSDHAADQRGRNSLEQRIRRTARTEPDPMRLVRKFVSSIG